MFSVLGHPKMLHLTVTSHSEVAMNISSHQTEYIELGTSHSEMIVPIGGWLIQVRCQGEGYPQRFRAFAP